MTLGPNLYVSVPRHRQGLELPHNAMFHLSPSHKIEHMSANKFFPMRLRRCVDHFPRPSPLNAQASVCRPSFIPSNPSICRSSTLRAQRSKLRLSRRDSSGLLHTKPFEIRCMCFLLGATLCSACLLHATSIHTSSMAIALVLVCPSLLHC